ncbi:hypothetical protein DFH08DRAFT_826490 [Mycena albidolilacea]|uniref:Uncharacterized protein n=1 Tax=Mycena albidolilacea TaxID=1033008 RepID=A0AAD6YZZ9_9AGAR|nr:hypothetical protein DFH08DRAFT_826490 [Mycena albidolilacea]
MSACTILQMRVAKKLKNIAGIVQNSESYQKWHQTQQCPKFLNQAVANTQLLIRPPGSAPSQPHPHHIFLLDTNKTNTDEPLTLPTDLSTAFQPSTPMRGTPRIAAVRTASGLWIALSCPEYVVPQCVHGESNSCIDGLTPLLPVASCDDPSAAGFKSTSVAAEQDGFVSVNRERAGQVKFTRTVPHKHKFRTNKLMFVVPGLDLNHCFLTTKCSGSGSQLAGLYDIEPLV